METKENLSKGITLVALVITIVILLILAGISIQSLTNTGLFDKANEAKKQSEMANVREQVQLEIYAKQAESTGEIKMKLDLKDSIQGKDIIVVEDIIDTGRYGCPNCYDVFEDRMDPILKKLQGANRHVGRLGKISNNNLKFQDKESKKEKKEEKTNPVDKLQEDLKKAIKEERYEDAAKIRDEIKKLSK